MNLFIHETCLIFIIFISDLFFSKTRSEVCNFADDRILYSYGENLNHVFSDLNYDLKNVLNWFKTNSLKVNLGKSEFVVLGVDDIKFLNVNVTGKVIPSSCEVKLLSIPFDDQLRVKKYIKSLFTKAFLELHAPWRIRRYLTVEHCVKYRNFTLFHGVEDLWKGTVSA